MKNKPLLFILQPEDNRKLANLCGEHDKNLRQIEAYFNVQINNRGHEFTILGSKEAAKKAKQAILLLFNETKHLRIRYPKIQIAPLIYRIEDNKLYLINEG